MATREFFDSLPARADPAQLEGVDHAYRFEIQGEGTWRVEVRSGAVTVTEGDEQPADATIRTSGEVFERIIEGRQNPATAYMTGKIKVDGDLGAVMKLQKLF